MNRSRRSVKKPVIEESSEDDYSSKEKYQKTKQNDTNYSSSSESDIENYLQPINKIDLSSSFFNLPKKSESENKSKANTSQLSKLIDSTDEDENDVNKTSISQSNVNYNSGHVTNNLNIDFQQMEEFKRNLEETKRHVDNYNEKRISQEIEPFDKISSIKKKIGKQILDLDVSDLLALGESKKQLNLDNIRKEDLHPSDFESSEDDWEEVKVTENQDTKDFLEKSIPTEGIQITVDTMPNSVKKKKSVDFLAAMKRRLNRIRKENQVFVHKVHLLCWIAHGNYVNNIINNSDILSQALTLLPSDKSYPSGRTDLSYLEQIVQWYKKTIIIIDKPVPSKLDLLSCLQLQITRKQVFNNKMYVFIFIAILRALGIQIRLVMSFQVEPLKPPTSELHSLAKDNPKSKGKNNIPNKTEDNIKTKTKTDKIIISKPKTVINQKAISTDINQKKLNKEKSFEEVKQKLCKIESHVSIDKKVALKQKITNSQTGSKLLHKTAADKIDEANTLKKKLSVSSDKMVKRRSATKVSKEPEVKVLKLENLRRSKRNILQVDGKYDTSNSSSDSEINCSQRLLQVDGPSDAKKKQKAKFQKLNLSNNSKPTINKKKAIKFSKIAPQKGSKSLKIKISEIENSQMDDSEDEFLSNESRTASSKSKTISHNIPKKQLDVRNDIMNLIKGRISEQKHINYSRMVKKRRKTCLQSDSDSDYAPEPIKKKYHDSDSDKDYFVPKPKVKKRIRVKKEGNALKVISSDSELDESGKKKKKGINIWAEVFLEAEEKWISADIVKGQVHCVNEIYARTTHPISYIVAWKNDNTLKDVTRRYCKNFSTVTRKLRVDPKWFEETIKPFMGSQTIRDKEEDDDLNRQQLDQPMPKAISEYKNHPLYALKRHLLKFEAIYPDDQIPLGYVRGEAVYPRNSVYVCKSRDIWLKEALVVKPGEKPYKIVKARPKYDRLSNTVITDQMLEIFGPWQTMDYEPPTAENGVVPRNAFGNVELFKSCMLPKGTIHIRLAGLNKVCKKLNVDCASAIVGFDFHGGWSHPVYDGFVICEEFADKVIAAWELEQEEIERKENEKIEQRIYGNWKRLIKGLLIRERLKAKYDFGEPSLQSNNKTKKGSRASKKHRKSSSSEGDWDDID